MDTKALRQKILDLAIRGKLVPQDPDAEPASVLLERIREQKQQMVKEGKLKKKDIKNDSVIFVGEDNLHYEKFADGSVKCIEEEIPFELPEGWAWERLSNLAAFSGGKTPSTSHREYWDGDVLWVTSKDMKSKYITSSQLRLSALGAEQMQLYQSDTLLLVTRSGILRHTLPVSILKECATINQDLKAIVLYMPQLAEYIYVCLKGMETKLLLKYTKSGTTVENVNFDEFQKLLLPIAPIQEINRIITSTGEAEYIVSAIEEGKMVLAEYITKAKSKILDLAIRGQLVPQNPNDEPASVLLERIRAEKEELIKQGKIKRDKKESIIFKGEDNSYYETISNKLNSLEDSNLFDLPDNWCWCRVRSIADVKGGKRLPKGCSLSDTPTDHAYIRVTDMKNQTINTNDLKYISDEVYEQIKSYIISKNDLYITIAGTIGVVGEIPDELDNMNLTENAAKLCNIKIDKKYLCYILSSKFVQNQFQEKTHQVAMPKLALERILTTIIPVPPYKEQVLIVKKVEDTLSQMNTIENSI